MAATFPAPIYRGQANRLFRTDKANEVVKRGQEAPYGQNAAPPGTSASGVAFTPTGGLSATNVQDAIDELDTEKQPKITAQTGWAADTGTASKTAHATYAAPTISNPPTQAEVQAIANALQAATQENKALKDALLALGFLAA